MKKERLEQLRAHIDEGGHLGRPIVSELLTELETLHKKLEWEDGFPPRLYSDEDFIAITIYGDKVALRFLPEDATYDFFTADDTYIMKDNIKKWMPFPDSEFTT